MGYILFDPNKFNSGGGGGGGSATLGARLTYASPAGGAVAAAPAGFSNLTGRLIVTLAGGDATWISLTGGDDGQMLVVINADVANTLILSAIGFAGPGVILPPSHRALFYYDSTDLLWESANA